MATEISYLIRHLGGKRQTLARRLLVGGVGIRMLATLLGHTDPAFTMRRYARFLPSDVRALDVDFLSNRVS
jgi:integrase